MLGNDPAIATLVATLAVMVVGWLVADQADFLRPYRNDLLSRHSGMLFLYALMLGLNVAAGTLLALRKLGLRRTGAKLSHLKRDKTLEQHIANLTPPQE